MIKENKIKAYILKNALEHNGNAQINPIINSLFNEGLKKKDIPKTIPIIHKIIDEINKLTIEQQQNEFEKLINLIGKRETRQGLPELANVKKQIIMRFAPSPSGPLHIGHALTASLSYLYVKRYGGKFYIRIEDTNPENIYKPAYKMIKDESKWLFNNPSIIIQSERMNLYYKYIEMLLKKNSAYICTCSQEEFKKTITEMKECPCRHIPFKEQKDRWKNMLDRNGYKEGQAVVRFKTSVKHKNPAFRDFPLARINLDFHPLQKNKYKVWPLMNLAVTVDDIELNITHIIRAKDHRDNAEKQKLIFKVLGKKYPESYFLGRIHLKDLILSSSQMRKDIEEGKYSGWDDHKLLTIASLKKQGYKPIAFHAFAEQIGLNEVDKNIDRKELFLLLNNFNTEKN